MGRSVIRLLQVSSGGEGSRAEGGGVREGERGGSSDRRKVNDVGRGSKMRKLKEGAKGKGARKGGR